MVILVRGRWQRRSERPRRRGRGAQALEHVGLPEAQLNLAQAAIYLARAPKSNASAVAIWDPAATCASTNALSSGHAPLHRAQDRREGARPWRGSVYHHDDTAGFDVSYLPRSFADGGTVGRPAQRGALRWR